jgi:hypothetical protein
MRRRVTPLLLFLLIGLATTAGVAFLLTLLVEVQQGPQSQAESLVDDERWTVNRWDRAGAVRVRSARVRGLNWSPQQAAGEPDTPVVGDQVTAWASSSSDAGTEWLVLHYAKAVVPRELHVYESCGPGALFRVTVLDEGGNEVPAWEGTDPSAGGGGARTPGGVAVSKVPLSVKVATNRVKIYLASDKVPNWNEVDAVALIGESGERQWARHVQASSTYASAGAAQGGSGGNPALITPGWAELAPAREAFASGAANREERVVDGRGWPLLAFYSETDLLASGTARVAVTAGGRGRTPAARSVTGSRQLGLSGALAVSTPAGASDVRPPIPMRPIWSGVAVNTVFYAACWLAVWGMLTIPRRFVRDLARVRRGACIGCGYDLGFDFVHGCPECGWRRDAGARPSE